LERQDDRIRAPVRADDVAVNHDHAHGLHGTRTAKTTHASRRTSHSETRSRFGNAHALMAPGHQPGCCPRSARSGARRTARVCLTLVRPAAHRNASHNAAAVRPSRPPAQSYNRSYHDWNSCCANS
jgi:hypothetical protein